MCLTILSRIITGNMQVSYYRIYREPLTAGPHVTSLSRHVWGLLHVFST